MDILNSIPLIGPLLSVVLPFLLVLSVVVAIHELGHLMVGRWCGIRAEVYSIGFGRVLWSRKDKYGTVWQIAALPLGGFVKFLGDMDPASAGAVDDSALSEDEKRHAFHNAALWKRTLTVLAGPVANFILSLVIFFGLALYIGKPSDIPVIESIGDLNPAEIGMMPGDRVLEVDGAKIETYEDVLSALLAAKGAELPAKVLRDGAEIDITTRYERRPRIVGSEADGAALGAGLRPGDELFSIHGTEVSTVQDVINTVADLPLNTEITIIIQRDGQKQSIAFTPATRTAKHPVTGVETTLPFLGIHMNGIDGLHQVNEGVTISEAASAAVRSVTKIVTDTITYIDRMLFHGATTDHLSGPVGIAKHAANAASNGVPHLIQLVAFISTAIGLLNLFPIPVLDGGHLVFYLVEAIRRKPANEAVVRYGSVAGLSLLLLLMVFVTFNNDLGLGAWLTQD